MRFRSLWLSAAFLCVPGMAQTRTILRPIPIPPPAVSNQLIKIRFRPTPNNLLGFRGMDLYLADGTVLENWKIPSGKLLVLTDFSTMHFTHGPYPFDVSGRLGCDYPNGASFTVLPILIKAGQYTGGSVYGLTTGLTFSDPDGPSFSIFCEAPGDYAFQANVLWGFGYLTDAN